METGIQIFRNHNASRVCTAIISVSRSEMWK